MASKKSSKRAAPTRRFTPRDQHHGKATWHQAAGRSTVQHRGHRGNR